MSEFSVSARLYIRQRLILGYSKTFCKILLNRIESEIDNKLREEQAGFRKNRGCIDQIFALRNIIEQTVEYNEQLHINFIDFKKAFDSLHRASIWKI